MAELSEAKILGGVGSLLILLSLVPNVGPLLGIVGFVLVLIAVKYVADVVGERAIFNNMLVSTILGIVGIIVGLVVGIISFFGVVSRMGGVPNVFQRWSLPESLGLEELMGVFVGLIIGLIVIWIFYIISAIFLRRSFTRISERLNVKLFDTAALLYLIGSILIIVLIGFVLILVALILQIIAFFSIPEKPAQPVSSIMQPM